MRPPNADGHTWHLDVRSSAAAREVTLELQIAGDVPPGFEIVVFDDDVGNRIPVARPTASDAAWSATLQLLAHGPDRAYRLRPVAGTPEYIAGTASGSTLAAPARVTLEQNAPNPFNAATRLRFGLPQAGRVRLELFDVRGRRVARLWDGPRDAGWHAILWNGRDDSGRPVASGVYIYHVEAKEGGRVIGSTTGKMAVFMEKERLNTF